jgi:dissimilatory sulfite reductase (desulfoviridin) alpha/beta subunit
MQFTKVKKPDVQENTCSSETGLVATHEKSGANQKKETNKNQIAGLQSIKCGSICEACSFNIFERKSLSVLISSKLKGEKSWRLVQKQLAHLMQTDPHTVRSGLCSKQYPKQ